MGLSSEPAAVPVEGEGVVELDHWLSGQITGGQHLQSLDQLHHGIIVLSGPTERSGTGERRTFTGSFLHCGRLRVCTCMSRYENSRFMTMSCVRTSVLSIRSLIRESSLASSSPWYFSLAFLMSFSSVSLKEALPRKSAFKCWF